MSLENKRIAVLAEEQYDLLELWYPTIRMKEEGAEVVIIGTGKPSYKSKEGKIVEVDMNATDADGDDFDGIIIPGGFAPDKMRRYPAVLDLVRKIHHQGKPVAFICHAGWVPISAKIVEGKTVTSTVGIRDDLINAGAIWVDQEVVIDGNMITSRGPNDLPAFCKAVIKAFSE
ncbi:MAG: type 1 glutamine amidotransferase [Anaerolineales bacterium]|jgi:protease I